MLTTGHDSRTSSLTSVRGSQRAHSGSCSAAHADLSVQRLSVAHFSTRGYALRMHAFTRVRVLYVHDKLLCTRL